MGVFRADSDAMRWVLVGLTAVIAGLVAVWMWREKARRDVLAMGLVLGGALGNILDWVRFGYVVAFADFHIGEWPPFLFFNLSGSGLSLGVLHLFSAPPLLPDKGA